MHISQPPGEANALGRIRFNFPNKFLVYQHDTPDKHLFAQAKRAYSHGCMRVQDPDKYAAMLLNLGMPGDGYTQEQIRSMYGHCEIDLKFTTPIPVHITYQTAFVDDAGKLQIREDIYGRDASMLAAAEGRPPQGPRERRRALAAELRAADGHSCPPTSRFNDGYSSGQSFFDRLFGHRRPRRRRPVAATAAAAPVSPADSPSSTKRLTNQRPRSRSGAVYVNHSPPGSRPRALFRHTRPLG